MDLLDFIEVMFTGNWKYISGFLLGVMIIGSIGLAYRFLVKSEKKHDQAFVTKHRGEPIDPFKKNVRNTWMILILLCFVGLPATLFIVIKALGAIPDLEPWIGVTSVFGIFILFLIPLIILTVHAKRLSRRIRLLESTTRVTTAT